QVGRRNTFPRRYNSPQDFRTRCAMLTPVPKAKTNGRSRWSIPRASRSPPFRQAADQCRDALASGTLTTLQVQNDLYSNTDNVVREEQQKASSSDKSTKAHAEAVYKKVPIKADYEKADNERMSEMAKKSTEYASVVKDKGSFLLQTGDTTIIGAWLKCMEGRSGLAA